MSRWFRIYDDAMHDPKVQRLPAKLFKLWFNLLCLASKNGGVLPCTEDTSYALRISRAEVEANLADLARRGLLDPAIDGRFAPHNWEKRQYKSDHSTTRVHAHRSKNINKNNENIASETANVVTLKRPETVSETPPEQNRTEQSQKQKKIYGSSKAMNPENERTFEEFWEVYPKRDGANPKAPAKVRFLSAVMKGADSPTICAAAGRYAAECRRLGTEKTPMVAQAVTWLAQRRWEDYPELAPAEAPTWAPPPGMKSLKEEWANDSTADIRIDAGPRQNGSNRVEQLQLPGGGSLRVEVRSQGKSSGDPPW